MGAIDPKDDFFPSLSVVKKNPVAGDSSIRIIWSKLNFADFLNKIPGFVGSRQPSKFMYNIDTFLYWHCRRLHERPLVPLEELP